MRIRTLFKNKFPPIKLNELASIMYFKTIHLILSLLFGLFLFSCTSNLSAPQNSCPSDIPSAEFGLPINLEITAPNDFGGTVRGSSVYQDSLLYLVADKPRMKIKIIDLKNRRFVGEIVLDPNFMDTPSGIQVHSRDSIFVSDFHTPIILLINSQGEVLDTYNLYKDDLWDMPVEDFANFGLFGGFGKGFQYIKVRNSFLVALKQVDQWYFVKDKKDFPAIGEYSLKTRDFVRVFGRYEGLYGSEENWMLPFFLSHPVLERLDDRIILSFPVDPNLYLYSLEGEFLGQKCGSIPEFGLPEPLRFDMDNYDEDGMMDYTRKNSYFGNLFYIKDADRFVRFYLDCEKGGDGICKSKKVYTLVFDRALELLEVKELREVLKENAYMSQVPFQNGFLSKLAERGSDDEFLLNLYYQLN